VRVYTSKLTPTYFMTVNTSCDCSAQCGTCVCWSAMIKVQCTLNSDNCTSVVLRRCAMFEELGPKSFASYFDLVSCHFAGFHVANRAGYTFATTAQMY